jgi:hypothetical protein
MMHDDVKELLELTRDNNKLLRKMRRHAIFGNVTRLIYWAVIFGVPVILYYYFLQPYMGQILDTYSGIQSGVEGVGDQTKGITDILNIFGIGR